MRMLLALVFGFSFFPIMATAAPPPAPQTLVIIACKADDLTGQPGRHDPAMAAKGWRDLELHVNENNEYECKREIAQIEDAAIYQGAPPLATDFSKQTQCARISAGFSAMWNEQHKGWAVVGVGCPVAEWADNGTPKDKSDDYQVGWRLPGCPSFRPGTNNRMRCSFDESAV